MTLLFVAACGGSTGGGTSGSADPKPKDEGVLRIGWTSPPQALDPAKAGVADRVYTSLGYAPLINAAPDGTYQPALAESWKETAGDNTKFEIKLRDGLKFSDGTPLNAEAVKANIEYHVKSSGPDLARLSLLSKMEVVDARTLALTFSQPQPTFADLFSSLGGNAGRMISPAALAKPEQLATKTFGAGPYVLSSEETVLNDTYVYLPNPNFWEPKNIYYKRIEVKVLSNPNSAVAALRTGQVDVISVGPDIFGQGTDQQDGIEASTTNFALRGIVLTDREGTKVKALGDVRVRQALNYAIDRKAITTAILGKYGVPTDQMAALGAPWRSATDTYTYDVAKAKALLAEAGYADGFKFTVVTNPVAGTKLLEAMAVNFAAIGVTMEIKTVEMTSYGKSLGEYPASALGQFASHPYLLGRALWLKTAKVGNPFHSSDPELEKLDTEGMTADAAAQATVYGQLIKRLTDQAWFVPVLYAPVVFFHKDTVNIPTQEGGHFPLPDSWRPATTS